MGKACQSSVTHYCSYHVHSLCSAYCTSFSASTQFFLNRQKKQRINMVTRCLSICLEDAPCHCTYSFVTDNSMERRGEQHESWLHERHILYPPHIAGYCPLYAETPAVEAHPNKMFKICPSCLIDIWICLWRDRVSNARHFPRPFLHSPLESLWRAETCNHRTLQG